MVKNHLKEIRMKEYMLNQKEFAELLNIEGSTYNNWEKSLSKPTLEKALDIALKLNRKVEDIWYLE